jgi:aldehyde dehydrogenase (NAD+)
MARDPDTASPRTHTDRRMYVDGQWVKAADGASFEVLNPATEEVLGAVPDATLEDIRRAIGAARLAFDEGPWPRTSRSDRARLLRQLAAGIDKKRQLLATLMVAECGTASWAAAGMSIDVPIQYLNKCADWTLELELEEMAPLTLAQTPTGPRLSQMLIVRQPVGVCGLIPTWNAPLICTARKVGAAIATACTMVVKPSPWASLIHLELAKIIEELDLPRGVFHMLTGQRVDVSQELATNPAVDLINFTGGVPTGKRIMAAASGTLKRVILELGGKSPNIILEDVDVPQIAASVASAAWVNAGQACIASTRVLVPEQLHDALVDEMTRALASIKIGNPAQPDVMMGPLIREERRQSVEGFVQSGLAEGARLVAGGRRPPQLARGFFFEPTIFTAVTNDMRIAREEIFGPVVCVIPVSNTEEAIRIANDTRYGLAANILTTNTARAVEIARRLRAGNVTINGALDMIETPRGGFKESGLGREGGKASLYEYTEKQSINWLA